MKCYPQELKYLETYLADKRIPELSKNQHVLIKNQINYLREKQKKQPWIHNFMESLPFIIIFSSWYFLIFILPTYIDNRIILFITLTFFHGFLGYQLVIYGLHEGAGHGLFKNQQTLIHKILRFLSFNSSRLLMADPIYYKKVHPSHHSFLGTNRDKAQVNFVSTKRIFLSLIPGAGILFPNDYKIHKGESFTKSDFFSTLIGLTRASIEYLALSPFLSTIEILSILFLLSPWIGLSLDRIRESLEHHLMPQSKFYGSRELGLSPLSLLVSGGPWGQPCHLSHHLAPDLNWYQQIKLHFFLKKKLNEEQKLFFGFSKPLAKILYEEIKKHFVLERGKYEKT